MLTVPHDNGVSVDGRYHGAFCYLLHVSLVQGVQLVWSARSVGFFRQRGNSREIAVWRTVISDTAGGCRKAFDRGVRENHIEVFGYIHQANSTVEARRRLRSAPTIFVKDDYRFENAVGTHCARGGD